MGAMIADGVCHFGLQWLARKVAYQIHIPGCSAELKYTSNLINLAQAIHGELCDGNHRELRKPATIFRLVSFRDAVRNTACLAARGRTDRTSDRVGTGTR